MYITICTLSPQPLVPFASRSIHICTVLHHNSLNNPLYFSMTELCRKCESQFLFNDHAGNDDSYACLSQDTGVPHKTPSPASHHERQDQHAR